MRYLRLRFSKTVRVLLILALTIILAAIIAFLIYSSEDTHWGSSYWVKWLTQNYHFNYLTASLLVKWLRKILHFLGYGSLGCFAWFYFYLWRTLKPLMIGLIFTVLISILDEYTQSLTTFRSGKPADVLLDIAGAVVITSLIKLYITRMMKHVRTLK